MTNIYEIWDKYFIDRVCDWDIYREWTEDWIRDSITDINYEIENEEDKLNLSDEEIHNLFLLAEEYKEEIKSQDREEALNGLRSDIDEAITYSENSTHLNNDDIGKILCKLAAEYFEE